MNTYPKYKDSGEQWLGQIPAHWEMKRLAACFAKRSENWKRGETLELLSLLKDVGVVPYSEKGNIGNTAKTDFSQYKVARKGDLVINSMNVIIGSLGITPMDGYISPAYYAFAPREGVNTRYYNYILSLRRAQQNIRRFSKGIMEIRLKISANDFLSIQYPVPPKDEQEAMVAYLDEQTAQIDNAIAREQKMIDLLEERKQIIIQQAVTKGTPKKLKFLVDCNTQSLSSNTRNDVMIEYVEISDVTQEDGIINTSFHTFKEAPSRARRITKKGDIILSCVRTYLKAIAKIDRDGLIVSTGFAVLTPKRQVNGDYLYYCLIAESFLDKTIQESKGTSYPAITTDALLDIKIPYVEDVAGQTEIVESILRGTASIDNMIKKYNRKIALLQERKQIIINEVVTGKIKVL